MPDMNAIASTVDEYVRRWKNQTVVQFSAPRERILFEDNDFGFEVHQVFRAHAAGIWEFSHDELLHLVTLLTRSLQGQINRDHKILWSWIGHVTRLCPPVFDQDWRAAFCTFVNALLAAAAPRIPSPLPVNRHLFDLAREKHTLAASLGFAVFEGTLRRANATYVGKDGVVVLPFNLSGTAYATGKRINRINLGIRLFEQLTVGGRASTTAALASCYADIQTLYSSTTPVPDLVDGWRNEMLHGNQYWQSRTPIIANLISLVVIDSIDPSRYDAERLALSRAASAHFPGETFPPDL